MRRRCERKLLQESRYETARGELDPVCGERQCNKHPMLVLSCRISFLAVVLGKEGGWVCFRERREEECCVLDFRESSCRHRKGRPLCACSFSFANAHLPAAHKEYIQSLKPSRAIPGTCLRTPPCFVHELAALRGRKLAVQPRRRSRVYQMVWKEVTFEGTSLVAFSVSAAWSIRRRTTSSLPGTTMYLALQVSGAFVHHLLHAHQGPVRAGSLVRSWTRHHLPSAW